jgi:hypothetical protein
VPRADVDRPGAQLVSRQECSMSSVDDTSTTTDGSRPSSHTAADLGVDRASVQARQTEQHGGMKIGSACFGPARSSGRGPARVTAAVAAAAPRR